MKIAIVEDEEALAQVLKEKLEKEKFDVKIAVDGETALPLIKAFTPDMILLDLLLPKKPGLDVLRDLKEEESLKNIPVIILSNLGGDEDIKEGLALGAKDYFVKTQHPINEVVDKIKEDLLNPKGI
ncbi:MAG: response regulator [Patescibacteria group bacterium]|nr:response regulator [Patescibacteria group bacterium]MCL5261835.1 response regulator [Patescibacteria group bacterium]